MHLGKRLTASGKPFGTEPSEAVLKDDFGERRPGEAPIERRAAASPDRALHNADAVDAQLDMLVAAVKPQREAGRQSDGVEAAAKRFFLEFIAAS
ncbi:hypothetical protein WMF31_23510 [Sorangium sp. So ce1036]|uniref:hypothetical protein n=1 Tax=Sorangium sp. So ce1036 TaxID=3133328 RepID=UPI003F0A1C44